MSWNFLSGYSFLWQDFWVYLPGRSQMLKFCSQLLRWKQPGTRNQLKHKRNFFFFLTCMNYKGLVHRRANHAEQRSSVWENSKSEQRGEFWLPEMEHFLHPDSKACAFPLTALLSLLCPSAPGGTQQQGQTGHWYQGCAAPWGLTKGWPWPGKLQHQWQTSSFSSGSCDRPGFSNLIQGLLQVVEATHPWKNKLSKSFNWTCIYVLTKLLRKIKEVFSLRCSYIQA